MCYIVPERVAVFRSSHLDYCQDELLAGNAASTSNQFFFERILVDLVRPCNGHEQCLMLAVRACASKGKRISVFPDT